MEDSVKGKLIFGRVVVLGVVLVCALCTGAFGQPWDGNGVEGDPYQIWDANDMQAIGADANYWDAHFELMADIDLGGYTGTEFNIIGRRTVPFHPLIPFSGVFDGNGHTISNFTYEIGWGGDKGIFGCIDHVDAKIRNLELIDPNVDVNSTGAYVGSLAGVLKKGTISSCYVQGGSVVGPASVGGLVGGNWYGTISESGSACTVHGGVYSGGLVGYNEGNISECFSEGEVSGNDRVGGLVGRSKSDSMISKCYSTAAVSGSNCVGGLVGDSYVDGSEGGEVSESYSAGSVDGNDMVGGLVGRVNINATISNCYSTAGVSGNNYVGGLVGDNSADGSQGGNIVHSYSAGSVSGTSNVGGMIGYDGGVGSYDKCFWDSNTSGQIISSGGEAKTTVEMQSHETFYYWGYEPMWTIDEGNDYPHLIWENMPGEVITIPLYGGGNGEPNDPYLIYTAGHLNAIGKFEPHWDKAFKLMADLDLSDYNGVGQNPSFNIIGRFTMIFSGVFDGNDHAISNLMLDYNGLDYIGLFGYVSGKAQIRNLGLVSADVVAGAGRYVGSLVGYLQNSTVSGCYVQGTSVTGGQFIGGLIGQNDLGTIIESSSLGGVSGEDYVGGLVGQNFRGHISNSRATVYVVGNGRNSGGLVGRNWSGVVEQCFANGDVSGNKYVGGLVGYNMYADILNCYASGQVLGERCIGGLAGFNYDIFGGIREGVLMCYSSGSVSGSHEVGGLLGSNNGGAVYSSYWDVQTSGQAISAGGAGKTTAEMETASTFIGWGGCGNDGVWTVDDRNDYPRLAWENREGSMLTRQRLSDFVSGSGEPNEPYLIYTSEQLNAMGLFMCEWDKHFKLMADIDLGSYTGTAFNIIGTSDNPFYGVFDGDGHTISNLTYDCNGIGYVGLFGMVGDSNADVRNLGLIDPNINVGIGDYVGSFAGASAKLSNCYVEGANVTGRSYVGGLIGTGAGEFTDCYSNGIVRGTGCVGGLIGLAIGYIDNCNATANVSGLSEVGGLIGATRYSGSITGCRSLGSVGGGGSVGGLIGSNVNYGWSGAASVYDCFSQATVVADLGVGGLIGTNSGEIEESYSTGDILGVEYVGGLVGSNAGRISNCCALGDVSGDSPVGGFGGSSSGEIVHCYSVGEVSGSSDTGGFIGMENGGSYYKCFWDRDINPGLNGIWNTSDPNVIGLTTVEMQMESTFTDAGWDFVGEVVNGANDIWEICEGTNYAKFVWQIPEADFVCPDGVNFEDYAYFAQRWYETDYGDVNGAELTGDGKVNWDDFGLFAGWWMVSGCGGCGGADLTGEGDVDYLDLGVFAGHWLDSEYGDCGGAELTGDGVVGLEDLREFTENWLAGL